MGHAGFCPSTVYITTIIVNIVIMIIAILLVLSLAILRAGTSASSSGSLGMSWWLPGPLSLGPVKTQPEPATSRACPGRLPAATVLKLSAWWDLKP